MNTPNNRPEAPDSIRSGWLRAFVSRLEKSSPADLIRRHRTLFFNLVFGGLSILTTTFAFLIRFDLAGLDVHGYCWHPFWWPLAAATASMRLLSLRAFGRHRASWRYASLDDVRPMLWSVMIGSTTAALAWLTLEIGPVPVTVMALDALLYLLGSLVVRFAYRLLPRMHGEPFPRRRALIVGAGAAGNLTIEAMFSAGLRGYRPVALVDDDPLKRGLTIHGVEVKGPIADVGKVARRSKAEAIVLAVPSASTAQVYRIAKACRDTGLPLKTIPDFGLILENGNSPAAVRDFDLDVLLNRRPMREDVPRVNEMLAGRTVLVTGAAGSIGSELCRQIGESDAKALICLDKDENGLFRIEQELRRTARVAELEFFLGDIKNRGRIDHLFVRRKPEIVFHAAAYKHVPVLQHHPVEAVLNNIGGTQNLAETARRHGAHRFVMISTDKAVRPTSVMGASKQVAEKIILRNAIEKGRTVFTTIRFGNVLGSNGSVVELFRGQIRRGGPVTVTHPDIERYFMTIPEAVRLVLAAAAIGEGKEVFVLDMGDPVRIDDLARQMITLSGLTPDIDVPVVYSGLRPGEKLYEELWADGEMPHPTGTPGILVAAEREAPDMGWIARVDGILAAAENEDLEGVWSALLKLVDEFQGRRGAEAALPPDAKTSGRRAPARKAAAATVGAAGMDVGAARAAASLDPGMVCASCAFPEGGCRLSRAAGIAPEVR